MHPADRTLLAIAEQQHGLVSRQQALSAGLTTNAIRHRHRSGTWTPIHRDVFRVAPVAPSWHQRLLAACFQSGGVASHTSAAHLWGLDSVRPRGPEITVGRPLRRPLPGVRVHHSTQFDPVDRRLLGTIPVTGPARTLLDLGASIPAHAVEHAVDDARRLGLVDWDDLLTAILLHCRRGRDGCWALRALVDARYGERQVPGSRFNRLVQRLLFDSGLPAPEIEYEVRTSSGVLLARVDLAYPEAKLAIELDGKATHLTTEAFERDRRRLNQLHLEGWRVLVFTWRFYTERTSSLVNQVRAALAMV